MKRNEISIINFTFYECNYMSGNVLIGNSDLCNASNYYLGLKFDMDINSRCNVRGIKGEISILTTV